MPILDTITFHKFKRLHNLELRDLGKINLLVGNNNSGKTSILEGLSLYANPLDIREWWLISRNREQEDRLTRTSVIDAIRWLFPQNSRQDLDFSINAAIEYGKFSISSQSNSRFPILSLEASYEVVEELRLPRKWKGRAEEANEPEDMELVQGLDIRVKIKPTTVQQTLFEDEEKLDFQIWENEPSIRFPRKSEYQTPFVLITTISHRSESNFRLLSEAKYQDFKDEVIKLLQEVDPDILDVQILTEQGSRFSNRFAIQIEHKKLGFAPLSSFGDGIRRLFHIALNLPRIQGGILLIDEIESAIHTEALQSSYRWLVKWCTEKDIQVFATTHSLEAVDALLAVTESDDQLVLYRLESEEDQTHVIRHGWERLKILREELGQEVRW